MVEEGIAFPQEERLDEVTGANFFREQSYCGVAFDIDRQEVMGLYILHPNNVGRCGRICNATFAGESLWRTALCRASGAGSG